MQTKEAVEFVLNAKGLTKYALAKSLKSAPVSVNQWLRGTRMSTSKAMLFKKLYFIEIENTYDSTSVSSRNGRDSRISTSQL